MTKYPVVYFQLKLLIKIWQRSQDENKEMVISEIKQAMKTIEENMYYEED